MTGRSNLRRRFWIEAILGTGTALLTLLTLITREWIEIIFRVDPDGGSGTLEWGIVIVLGAVALLFGLLARAEWRQAATAAPDGGL